MAAGALTILESRSNTGSGQPPASHLAPPPFGDGAPFWTNDHSHWYRTVYLKSDHWRNLQRQKRKQNPSCQRCGATSKLDIHHVNYHNIFDVQLSDLLTLCRRCHTQEHTINGTPKRSLAPLRQSQKEFPLPARIKIHQQALVKYGKFVRHIEKRILNGLSFDPSNRRMADLHRQLAI